MDNDIQKQTYTVQDVKNVYRHICHLGSYNKSLDKLRLHIKKFGARETCRMINEGTLPSKISRTFETTYKLLNY